MRSLVLAILTVCATSSVAVAAQEELIYHHGLGAEGCGKHIAWRREGLAAYDRGIVQWTWGYISAFNNAAKKQTPNKTLAPTTVLAYLDKYCRDHPLELVTSGVQELIQDLGGRL